MTIFIFGGGILISELHILSTIREIYQTSQICDNFHFWGGIQTLGFVCDNFHFLGGYSETLRFGLCDNSFWGKNCTSE